MSRDVLSVLLSIALIGAYTPSAFASSDLNFKIYSPKAEGEATSTADKPAADTTAQPAPQAQPASDATPADAGSTPLPSATQPAADQPAAAAPAPVTPATAPPATSDSAAGPIPQLKSETPEIAPLSAPQPQPSSAPAASAFDTTLTPQEMNASAPQSTPAETSTASASPAAAASAAPAADAASAAPAAASASTTNVAADSVSGDTPASADDKGGDKKQIASKTLQGYVHVVPTGTKIPIIMDTAVDSDTSQEGDEFEARTAEDLTIDGTTAVPAGSVIKGRIAQINAPKHLERPGSVALKFDTVTTPDNRQIPLVANLVARGGVVHARRGVKDILIDTGTFALPTAAGLAIGALAGNSVHSLGVGGGALIGAGIGGAVGIAILLAKKGKKIDVRPGDELKIELAEDLRMPMM